MTQNRSKRHSRTPHPALCGLLALALTAGHGCSAAKAPVDPCNIPQQAVIAGAQTAATIACAVAIPPEERPMAALAAQSVLILWQADSEKALGQLESPMQQTAGQWYGLVWYAALSALKPLAQPAWDTAYMAVLHAALVGCATGVGVVGAA